MKKINSILIASAFLATAQLAEAGSATWNLNPASNDWNDIANWTPATVPNGPSDTATFDVSNTTDVSLFTDIEANSIVFNPGASAFSISPDAGSSLTFDGAGIINNSGLTQEFVIGTDASNLGVFIQFLNEASAGAGTSWVIDPTTTGQIGGSIYFNDQSSAGDATFTVSAGLQQVAGGVEFFDKATAGNGYFNCEGSGQISFYGTASGGNATFVANPADFIGGRVVFYDKSNAANATLIAYGRPSEIFPGQIVFSSGSTGGNATVKLFGTGKLDIGTGSFKKLTIGSLEGDGDIDLGEKSLLVGSNNSSTSFSGIIFGSSGAKLIKIGTGDLILENENRYVGFTHIRRGRLVVNNSTGSATGKGFVAVEGGVLAGGGTVDGPVTVGTGSGHNGVLEPGHAASAGAALSIRKSLTFNSDGTCQIPLNSQTGLAGGVVANGVTIDGASFSVADTGAAILAAGKVFIVINNTAATPIVGTFSNLADGAAFTLGNNTFQASYEGGDGNDLTLTVTP